MKIITNAEAQSLKVKSSRTREKSILRKNIEDLEVNQTALLKNSGHDYHKYSQLYNAVNAVKKTMNRDFNLKELADCSGAVLTRTA